jgi:hypothetical protein
MGDQAALADRKPTALSSEIAVDVKQLMPYPARTHSGRAEAARPGPVRELIRLLGAGMWIWRDWHFPGQTALIAECGPRCGGLLGEPEVREASLPKLEGRSAATARPARAGDSPYAS